MLLGMPVPEQRKVARAHRDAPLADCAELLRSEVHEHRFVALAILRHRFERGDELEREQIADLYLGAPRGREQLGSRRRLGAVSPGRSRARRAPRD